MKPTRDIEIKRVSLNYTDTAEKFKVLEDISFNVAPGEFVCIVGSSGGGKSTLLRILAGLQKQTDGKIINMPDEVGFVFQNFALFPWLNVSDNISFGLRMQGIDKKQIAVRIHEEVARIGLQGFENTHPKELSGGMKQRVGIARALAIHPKVLLLDEPFSALDEITAKGLRHDLLRIHRETHQTIIMVTHLVEEAIELADRIIVMSPRPGRIRKILPNKLARPRNLRSKEFFKLTDEVESLL